MRPIPSFLWIGPPSTTSDTIWPMCRTPPKPPEDPIAFLRAQVIEDVPDMVLGGFAEWLMNKQRLSPKIAGNRITPLKAMWIYAIQNHILKGPQPVDGRYCRVEKESRKEGG